jgi:hypothetical protein
MKLKIIVLLSIICFSFLFATESQFAYRVLIDCGSTGSRVYIYRYDVASPLTSLEEIANKRVRPALSRFYLDESALQEQFSELIEYAEEHITDLAVRSLTPIEMKATAGLRVLDVEKQMWLVDKVKSVLEKSSFFYDADETRVLSGGEEALFGLIATNMALSNVSSHAFEGFRLAAADLGGSSKQISFMLPLNSTTKLTQVSHNSAFMNWISSFWGRSLTLPPSESLECSPDYRLYLSDSSSSVLDIFAKSLPGMGIVEAMEELLTKLSENMVSFGFNSSGSVENNDSPVLFLEDSVYTTVDATVINELVLVSDSFQETGLYVDPPKVIYNPCISPTDSHPLHDFYAPNTRWVGTGNFEQCAALIREIIYKKASKEIACLKQLQIPRIVAMDNFPKVLEILNLSSPSIVEVNQHEELLVTPLAIKQAGVEVCQRPWTEIMNQFNHSIPEYRAQNACFGSAFVYTVATELYGIPEADTTSFLPIDSHKSYTLGWPLGWTMVAVMNWSYEAI